MKEQIFISYRREGGTVIARLICESLKNEGYSVFYDYDSIQNGVFSDRITSAIRDCTDFILVLSPHALDRCINEDDFVRREIRCALEHRKNIIPIFLDGFEFPQYLPPDIASVMQFNGFHYHSDYHQAGIERIAKMTRSNPGRVRRQRQNANIEKSSTAYKPPFSWVTPAKIAWFVLMIAALVCCFAEQKEIFRVVAVVLSLLALGAGYYIARATRREWQHYGKTLCMTLAGVMVAVSAVGLLGLIRVPDFDIKGGELNACYLDEATIEVPDGVAKINGFAFAGVWWERAKHIQVIRLPDSVYTICQGAFSGCDALREVYIGANVKLIEGGAFTSCAHLTIYFDGSQEQWEQISKGTGLLSWDLGLVDYKIVFLK